MGKPRRPSSDGRPPIYLTCRVMQAGRARVVSQWQSGASSLAETCRHGKRARLRPQQSASEFPKEATPLRWPGPAFALTTADLLKILGRLVRAPLANTAAAKNMIPLPTENTCACSKLRRSRKSRDFRATAIPSWACTSVLCWQWDHIFRGGRVRERRPNQPAQNF